MGPAGWERWLRLEGELAYGPTGGLRTAARGGFQVQQQRVALSSAWTGEVGARDGGAGAGSHIRKKVIKGPEWPLGAWGWGGGTCKHHQGPSGGWRIPARVLPSLGNTQQPGALRRRQNGTEPSCRLEDIRQDGGRRLGPAGAQGARGGGPGARAPEHRGQAMGREPRRHLELSREVVLGRSGLHVAESPITRTQWRGRRRRERPQVAGVPGR